jgi:hypothetical protein
MFEVPGHAIVPGNINMHFISARRFANLELCMLSMLWSMRGSRSVDALWEAEEAHCWGLDVILVPKHWLSFL